jgi:hypothetical protein
MTNPVKVLQISAAALIASALCISCVSSDKYIGSNLIPTDQQMQVLTDVIDLPVDMETADSIQGYSSSYLIVGSINYPEFGTTDVGTAFDLGPTYDSIPFKGDPKFKEFYMNLVVSTGKTMSDDQAYITQNLYVYPLLRSLDTTDVYSNSIKPADVGTNIIAKGIPVYHGDGTVEIDIKDSYASQYMDATQEEIDSTELFAKRFKGVYICTDPQEADIYGGRMNFIDLSSSYGYLVYERTDSTGARTDTTITFTIGKTIAVNCYKTQSGKLATKEKTKNLYVEGMSGIKPHISALTLRKTLSDWAAAKGYDMDKIIITRATMVFPFDYDGDYKKIDYYPSYLYPTKRSTSSGYTFYAPLSEVYDSKNDKGAINRSIFCYKPDATLYIQDMIHSPIDSIDRNDDIWMAPVSKSTSSSSSSSSYNSYYQYYMYMYYGYSSSSSETTYYTTDYVNYYASVLKGAASDDPPRLEITYVVLK